MSLTTLREEIDTIDQEIVRLLSRRMGIVKQIGALKKGQGITDPEREQEVLDNVLREESQLPPEFLEKVYRLIIEQAKELQ